jgi:hypothetical protein
VVAGMAAYGGMPKRSGREARKSLFGIQNAATIFSKFSMIGEPSGKFSWALPRF